MTLNPCANDRIVDGQIREWHASRDADRLAHGPANQPDERVVPEAQRLRDVLAAVAMRVATSLRLRQRSAR